MSITSKAKFFGTHSRDHESDCCQLKIETVSPSAKLKPDRLTASPEQRRYRSNFSQLSLVRGTIRYLRTLKATALASSGDTASLNLAVAGPIQRSLQQRRMPCTRNPLEDMAPTNGATLIDDITSPRRQPIHLQDHRWSGGGVATSRPLYEGRSTSL